MEKRQSNMIAVAIIVAGLIIAAAILVVGQPDRDGRYVFGSNNNSLILDTQTGELWGRAASLGDGPWQRIRYFE